MPDDAFETEEGFMANLVDDQRETTALNRALDVAASENRRIVDENVRLRAEHKEWLAANAPGGWIDILRQHAKRSVVYKQENKRLRAELDALRRQEPCAWTGTCPMYGHNCLQFDKHGLDNPMPLYASPVARPAPSVPDGWESELLDWVSACQSAYHIDNSPGHRFGGLGSQLEENRQAVVEYVRDLLAAAPEAKP